MSLEPTGNEPVTLVEKADRFPWLPIVVMLLAGAVVCALFVASERGFPYWDFAAYEDQTLLLTEAARRSLGEAAALVSQSLGNDYNLLFALPLVPWVLLLGENRLVFILGVYFLYFGAYVFLVAGVARRAVPGRAREATVVAAAATLLTPAGWTHVLQGYPDVVGAALIAGCVLIYGRWDRRRGIVTALAFGMTAATSILLRRHYVYAVAALYSAVVVDQVIQTLTAKGDRTRLKLRDLLSLAAATGATAGLVILVTPQFVSRALGVQNEMAPWQMTVGDTLVSMVATVGALPLGMAALGWILSGTTTGANRPVLRLTALATSAWVIVWAGHSRQQPYHYPHWLPLFVVLGTVLLWFRIEQMRERMPRALARGATVGIALASWLYCMPVFSFHNLDPMAFRLLPDPVGPNINPAYAAIVELVAHLRREAGADDTVLVAAASSMINPDIVQSAERTVFGRDSARLRILPSPTVDSGERVPTDSLIRASLVVIAEPVQYSLAPQYQKVVAVVPQGFRDRWPIAADFDPVPVRFRIPEGEILVYKRRRQTSPEVIADTSRRIDQFVLGRVLSENVWVVQSPLPFATARAEGKVNIQLHPARPSSGALTRLLAPNVAGERVEIAGRIHFLDSRCHGVEIVAVSGSGADNQSRVGVFSPAADAAPFDVVLANAIGRPLALEIWGMPSDREQIDFCTVELRGVTAIPVR